MTPVWITAVALLHCLVCNSQGFNLNIYKSHVLSAKSFIIRLNCLFSDIERGSKFHHQSLLHSREKRSLFPLLTHLKEFSLGRSLAALINLKKPKTENLFVPATELFGPLIFGVPALPPTGGKPVQSLTEIIRPQHPQPATGIHLNQHHHLQEQTYRDSHQLSHSSIQQSHSHQDDGNNDSPAIPPPYEGPAAIVSYHPLVSSDIDITHSLNSNGTDGKIHSSLDYSAYQEHPAFAPAYVSPADTYALSPEKMNSPPSLKSPDYTAFAPAYVAPTIPPFPKTSDFGKTTNDLDYVEKEYVAFQVIDPKELEISSKINDLFNNYQIETHIYDSETDDPDSESLTSSKLNVEELPLPYYGTYHMVEPGEDAERVHEEDKSQEDPLKSLFPYYDNLPPILIDEEIIGENKEDSVNAVDILQGSLVFPESDSISILDDPISFEVPTIKIDIPAKDSFIASPDAPTINQSFEPPIFEAADFNLTDEEYDEDLSFPETLIETIILPEELSELIIQDAKDEIVDMIMNDGIKIIEMNTEVNGDSFIDVDQQDFESMSSLRDDRDLSEEMAVGDHLLLPFYNY